MSAMMAWFYFPILIISLKLPPTFQVTIFVCVTAFMLIMAPQLMLCCAMYVVKSVRFVSDVCHLTVPQIAVVV